MNLLQTTTLAAQTIVNPLLIATYTATAQYTLLINVSVSGATGAGVYRACATRQRAGAGAIYQSPTSAAVLAATVTTLWLPSLSLAVNSGDVVKVYAQGLAADVAVGVVTEIFDVTVPALTAIAAAVWNYLTVSIATVGSIGKYIVDYLALIWGKAALIGSGSAMTTTPVTASGNVSIIKGDSYLNADGRRLEWTNTAWNVAVGSAIMVIIQNVENFTGTRLSATSIGLELTTAQTAALTEGNFLFSVQEVKVGGERITLVQGVWEMTVRPIPLT